MIMTYAAHRRDFGSFADEVRSKTETPPRRAGILRRILDAFIDSRQRDVDRQIARFLAARSARTEATCARWCWMAYDVAPTNSSACADERYCG